ncbi:MAG TPA: cache domain-containing protein [Usitatibacter sp.]|jgi:HAMP domain-containing protein|nr:cache domain-containing protein [Usitatibacter sp.]
MAEEPGQDITTVDVTRPLAPLEPRAAPARRSSGPTVALPSGYRLMEYRIDAVLGQGGFGIVYAATDTHLDARVVIKEYLPEDLAYRAADDSVSPRADRDLGHYHEGLDDFLVEARTLATFRHPNIVRVSRFFEANRTAYIVLEYERGQSLKQWRRGQGDLTEEAIVSLIAPLLDGLAAVHRAGYLHRDIKPDNIYVRDVDGSVVLLDFGAARQAAAEKAHPAAGVVTPGYAAIEQYAGGGAQGPWTDIYSMGATLYWLVTGNRPLDSPARTVERDPLPRAQDVARDRYSPQFLAAIDWALRLPPTERPQDIGQWRTLLFATHPAALGLQQALLAGDEDGLRGGEAWLRTLASPRALRARLAGLAARVRRPASWPLSVKLTLAMVCTALAPMIITAKHNLDSALANVSGVELRNLEHLAQSIAGRVSQLLDDSRNLANYLGTDEDFVAYLARPDPAGTTAILAKLQGLVNADPDVQFAMVMDTSGKAVVASDPDVMGKNFKFREYFKHAMEGRPHMTGITVGSVAGKSGVFYSRPVLAADGKTVIGAVVLRILAEPIGRILQSAEVAGERTPFLIDADGVIVWHPDPRFMYRSLVPLRPEVVDEIVADQRFRRTSIESVDQPRLATAMIGAREQGNVSYYSNVSGREEIAGFAPVPGHEWVVGVSESRDRFTRPLDRLFRQVLYSVALAGAVFVLVAMLFARSIVRPIGRLTAAADALKRGDYANANVPVKTQDEIGQLARTFNVMIDVLRQRERERGRRDSEPPGKDPE